MSVSKAIGRHVPFAELLGIRVTRREPGSTRLELDLQPELLNSWHVAHGGVVMALADMALGIAAITSNPSAQGVMTVDLKVSFLGPGQGLLVAEGRCLRSGSSLAFCEGEVRAADGELVAKALGTFKVRRGRGPRDGGAGPSAAGR